MARQLLWFSSEETPQINENNCLQLFSVAQDLKLEQRPLKQRYRLLIQDYTKFVQSKKSSLKSEDINTLDQMLVSRFLNLLNQVENDIYEGKFLSNLLGITDQGIRKAADRFTREYRKLLKARENLGYIPKMNQTKVDDNYKVLIAELRKKVFAPVMNLFSWDPSDLPESIELTDEEKELLTGKVGVTLSQLYDQIVGFLRSQNINAKINIVGDKIELKFQEDEKDTTKE